MADNCKTCKHRRYEPERGRPDSVHCQHPEIGGRLCCGYCGDWQNLDGFTLDNKKLRCGTCRALNDMPDVFDWRCGFVGFKPADESPPPEWCPGFEPLPGFEPPPKPSPQLSLF